MLSRADEQTYPNWLRSRTRSRQGCLPAEIALLTGVSLAALLTIRRLKHRSAITVDASPGIALFLSIHPSAMPTNSCAINILAPDAHDISRRMLPSSCDPVNCPFGLKAH